MAHLILETFLCGQCDRYHHHLFTNEEIKTERCLVARPGSPVGRLIIEHMSRGSLPSATALSLLLCESGVIFSHRVMKYGFFICCLRTDASVFTLKYAVKLTSCNENKKACSGLNSSHGMSTLGGSSKSVMQATEVYGFQAGCEETQQRHVRVGGCLPWRDLSRLCPTALSSLPHSLPTPTEVEHCHGDLFPFWGLHGTFF